MKVAIFCGSRDGNTPAYREYSYQLGSRLAQLGHTIIYGGGKCGIMGAIAGGALDSSGVVEAFTTLSLFDEEQYEDCLVRDFSTLSDRKKAILESAEAIIVLPGGWGTMDELFEVMVLRQWGQYAGKIGIYSIDGYYDGLAPFLDSMVSAGFVDQKYTNLITMSRDQDELLRQMGLIESESEEARIAPNNQIFFSNPS